MIRVWPKETDLNTLIDEPPGEDEKWDKGEAYIVELVRPVSLLARLKIMTFAENWPEERRLPEVIYQRMMNAYKEIETNEFFLKFVSYTLSIGNILNAGGVKGQSDGFEVSVLGKIASMKDNTNQTMMQYIMKKMYKDYPDDLHSGVNKLFKDINIKEVDVKMFETKCLELNTNY